MSDLRPAAVGRGLVPRREVFGGSAVDEIEPDGTAEMLRARAAPPYHVEEVRGRSGLGRLGNEWNALLATGPADADTPFGRHEWITAWVDAFAPDAAVLVLVARNSAGAAVGMAPFLQDRWLGMRRLVAPANDHSCRFEWALGPDVSGAVGAIWDHLRERVRWDFLVLRDLPRDGPTSTHLESLALADGFPAGRWESMRTPYLALDRGGVEERVDAKFRANLRRRLKRLCERGAVAYTRPGADGDWEGALRAFLALEASGWKGQRGTAISRDPRLVAFYKEVAKAAAARGWLSMRGLSVDGKPAAMHFALTYRGRYYLPKPAYDEGLSSCSPGQLLLREVIAECQARGLAELDFLGPDMPWKRDWEPLYRPHDWLYVYRPGFTGRAMHTLKHRVKPLAREVLGWGR